MQKQLPRKKQMPKKVSLLFWSLALYCPDHKMSKTGHGNEYHFKLAYNGHSFAKAGE
jgi:hypothetical protein